MLEILDAHAANLEEGRKLFPKYAVSLAISLDFQDFDAELAGLPGDYCPPTGRLLIAVWNGHVAGCVGMRKLTD